MLSINLPPAAWLTTRYGLMLGDQNVTMVSWKRGKFTLLGEFVNDTEGLHEFTAFLKKNKSKFNGKAINIVISVVGEDYRFERVAHLVGKFKTDMLNRKFQQLFRGANYHLASHQGREPVGRRQDLYLFCGILSSDKVSPWVRDLTRSGFVLAGLHLSSMATQGLLKVLTETTDGVDVLSVFGKGGEIRHNFFVEGKLRFSRLSRVADNTPADQIIQNIRVEIEKTSAYLVSLKLIRPNAKIKSHLLVPDDMVAEINEAAARAGGDRLSFNATSARLTGIAMGIKKPIEEYGRDASLVMHETLRSIRITQLAPLTEVRDYFSKSFAKVAAAAIVLWGGINLFNIGTNALDIYGNYTVQNASLQISIAQLKENYENQVAGFGVPPSTPANMRSAVNVLENVSDGRDVGPGKLMLYLSRLLENSRAIQLQDFNWYISNSPEERTGSYSFANGRKVYQVVELSGTLDETVDSEFAYNQYSAFIDNVKSRPDMTLTELERPSLVEADGELVVEIDSLADIKSELNAFTNNSFKIALAWEQGYGVQPTGS